MTAPRRRARRALVTVAVLVALVAGTAGTGTGTTAGTAGAAGAFPPARPTRVLVLGDSVMAGAASHYAPALPGRDVTVDAEVNRSTGQGADVVAARGSDWDVVVVLLAHNDGASPGVYQPAVRRLLDRLAGVPRVVWLTLHEVRPEYAQVNTFLRAEAAGRANLRVADWHSVAAANPGALAGDGLHLVGAGPALLAGVVADQVAAAEAELAPPPTTTTTTAPPPTTAPPTTAPAATAPPPTAPPTSTTTSTTTTAVGPTTSGRVEPVAATVARDEAPAPVDGAAPGPSGRVPLGGWVLVALAPAVGWFVARRPRSAQVRIGTRR